LGRNCRKPGLPTREWKKGYRWVPDHRTAKGTCYETQYFPDIAIDECPVSYITPESKEWLWRHRRMVRAWDTAGVQFYPPGEALARDMDALITIESEEARLDKARDEAEALDTRRRGPEDGG
jgi:hypothetical protein